MAVTVACYLDPTRKKADHWIEAFAAGCGGTVIRDGAYTPAEDHAVIGNWPVATALISRFQATGTGFWYLDSSYLQAAAEKCLRVERGRFWPVLEYGQHTIERAYAMGIRMQPWRHEGRHVLICLHGWKFGLPWGIDIAEWHAGIEARIRAVTDRPIVVRPKPLFKGGGAPLEADLADAWCVVTHSSTAAVSAVLAGVPVFCEPTCAAAPVGCTDFAQIESPARPDREPWLAELAWRQWTEAEMTTGEAWAHLRAEAWHQHTAVACGPNRLVLDNRRRSGVNQRYARW